MLLEVMAAAVPVVKTTGINIASVGTIIGGVVAALTFLDYRQTKKQNAIRTEIKDAVDNLSTVLSARLAPMNALMQLSDRVSRLEGSKDKS